MQLELTRAEVHGLIAACRDRKLVLDQGFIPNDPTPGAMSATPGAMSGYAMARSEIDRIGARLRELVASDFG